MDKQKAIEIIVKSAKIYDNYLKDNNILIISKSQSTAKYDKFEAVFEASNFMHLTGITNNKVSPKSFYNKSLKGQLSPNDFDFKKDGTTKMKLLVLPNILTMSNDIKMIGDFNNLGVNLYAEKLAGNTIACIGFKEANGFYIPISILKEDVRKVIYNNGRVVAIFYKNKKDSKYSNIKHINKKVSFCLDELPNEIQLKLDLEKLKLDIKQDSEWIVEIM